MVLNVEVILQSTYSSPGIWLVSISISGHG